MLPKAASLTGDIIISYIMSELLVKTKAHFCYSIHLPFSVELLAAKLWVTLKMQGQICAIVKRHNNCSKVNGKKLELRRSTF